MQAIILPTKPKWCEKILSGEKRVEFRKRGFKREVTHVVMHATAPVKKIVGWFEVNFIYGDTPSFLWVTHKHESGMTAKDFIKYYENYDEAIVIGIKEAFEVKPVELSALNIVRPPQNFYYLSEEQFLEVNDANKT